MAKKKQPDDEEGPALPGMEDERDDALIRAAKKYRKFMLDRKAAGELESDAHGQLIELMHDRGITAYSYRGVKLVLNVNEKCKVSTPDDGEDE
jgi:hypothetical protein